MSSALAHRVRQFRTFPVQLLRYLVVTGEVAYIRLPDLGIDLSGEVASRDPFALG